MVKTLLQLTIAHKNFLERANVKYISLMTHCYFHTNVCSSIQQNASIFAPCLSEDTKF